MKPIDVLAGACEQVRVDALELAAQVANHYALIELDIGFARTLRLLRDRIRALK